MGVRSRVVDVPYRLIDRGRYGFGLALDLEPHWCRVDETSGKGAQGGYCMAGLQVG
jgi:hypothetical protein